MIGEHEWRTVLRTLRTRLRGEVDDSPRRRIEYSSDASNYRVPPRAVAFPRDEDDVIAAVGICRAAGLPLTSRGGGTSVAGNAVGPGLVLDHSRHLNRITRIDPELRTATVQPGVVLDALQRAAAPHGLRFGPDPSTHSRCTLGGMIGNNACGNHSVAWGRTADNVLGLDVVDGLGRRAAVGADPEVVPGVEPLIRANLAVIRTELGRFNRQVSGYSLEHLLPERTPDLAKALVGTEGTCAVVLGATVRLVELPKAVALAVLGYPGMIQAAEDLPAVLACSPIAVEGLDARLVDVVRARRGASAVPDLPPGGGWLFVETCGADQAEALAHAERVRRAAGALGSVALPAGPAARALWRIREDGAGLAGRLPDGSAAWPGWEDAAVPTAALAPYLRELDALLRDHDLEGIPFGHFADGCIHVRLNLPIADDPGRFRAFLVDAARLIGTYGGSLSGEHGDGRARGELLPHMYSPAALALFAGFKACFDPDNLLNPGVGPDPRPLDADLRLVTVAPIPRVPGFALREDGGDLVAAAHRCVGVGACRATRSVAGGFMCPSYRATLDEKDSTRGRARVLQEVAGGQPLGRGWRSAELAESLDLCLACKACGRDCPTGVDMARYKAEVLHQRYRRRLRPITHYTLGRLPLWAGLAAPVAGPLNAVARIGPLRRALLRLAGVDPRRGMPEFARETFTRWWSRREARRREGQRVLLWPDTFTDYFSPEIGQAAVAVLEHAGYEVILPGRRVCCGLTWISTGQLDGARRRLSAALGELAPHAERGVPIVGLEPSCTAVLRSDLAELLPGDPRADAVASATRTLAELLGGNPALPRLDGLDLVVQPHCHHHAVLGFDRDRRLLTDAGARVTTVDGCCGLAGDFGMERGHYEISVAVAENDLLPALRSASPEAIPLADGFSCRLQAQQLAGRRPLHLARLLASRLPPIP
ncbi:FAD-binding and (Fe-S)-binding domain-containing protein [Rhizohabitans arisaemae]|uniref:FAD-binding and (Fe-S)-binding domain-containing protein n=1 Tax=Rhizohabitans arisaemae TaxID=2720610 RepID=UPI0024B2706E|nr:FAD-binding and (Fe-S)-binding domain-containing protein [Rhizohabitans arisaemae]